MMGKDIHMRFIYIPKTPLLWEIAVAIARIIKRRFTDSMVIR